MKDPQGEKNTIERMLEAATKLFAQRGFSGVSVKELAEAAAVNIASISYHFGGKEKLYMAVMEQQFAAIEEILRPLKQTDISAVESIHLIGELSLQVHKKCPYFNRLMLSENVNPNTFYLEEMAKEAKNFRELTCNILQRGVESGELRDDFDIRVAALGVVSLTQFYFNDLDFSNVFLEMENGENQAEYYIKNAIELFLRSVVKA